MSVTVIVPTLWRRRNYHQTIYDCYRNQTYKNKKLIVFEDGENSVPSEFWLSVATTDDTVSYLHEKTLLTIGGKRNRMIEMATTEYIAHFDDDDIYMPNYLEVMMNSIGDAYLCKLLGWLNYTPNMDYFNILHSSPPTSRRMDMLYHRPDGIYYYRRAGIAADADTWLEFGFSYLYKRSVYPEISFQDKNLGEDYEFAFAIKKKYSIKLVENITAPIVIKRQLLTNTSISWPNMHIPKGMISYINKIQIYGNHIFGLNDIPGVSKKDDMEKSKDDSHVKDDSIFGYNDTDISCQDAR